MKTDHSPEIEDNPSPSTGLERFLTYRFFFIPGMVFLWIGVLYAANDMGHFDDLLPLVLFLCGIIAWLAHKTKQPILNLINFPFAIAYFGLFWFTKFVVNSKPQFQVEFLIFNTILYFLFYLIVIFASNESEHPLRKWMQLVLTWSNFLFFLGTTSFVLIKYGAFGYFWLIALVLLRLNFLGLNLMKRYQTITWTLPHYFTGMLLAALVLPLLLRQNMVILFAAGFSIFMLIYANAFRDKAAMWISLFSMAVMIVLYLFFWINRYLPSLLTQRMLPDGAVMWHGVVSGATMIVALSITQWLLNKVDIPFSRTWFRRSNYYRFIRGFRLFSIFSTVGWIVFSLLCILTGTLLYAPVGWFISGSVYFIIMIDYYSERPSSLKLLMLNWALAFALLFPLLVHWNMTISRVDLIHWGNWDGSAFLLHYLALALFMILGIMIHSRIYRFYPGNILAQQGIQILTIAFLFFLCCTEYDNLSVFITSFLNSPGNKTGIPNGLLAFNHHLPYSIIMWVLTFLASIRAVLHHNLFLKSLSIVLYTGILVKVFAYDFQILNPFEKSVVFIVVGLFIVGLSIQAWYEKDKFNSPSLKKVNDVDRH